MLASCKESTCIKTTRLLQILDHMHNGNRNPLSPLNLIHPPTPHIATPLVQGNPTQCRSHLQPAKPANDAVNPRPRTRLTVPHHHGAQSLPGRLRHREDSADARTLSGRVTHSRHAERLRGRRGAEERAAVRPAAAGEEDVRGAGGREHKIGAVEDELRVDTEDVADGAAEGRCAVVAGAERRHAAGYEGLEGGNVGWLGAPDGVGSC